VLRIFCLAARQIDSTLICCLEQLGEGAFGRVYMGRYGNGPSEDDYVLVAIKVLKDDMSKDAKEDFEREAELLSTLEHPNIVHFYGVCIENVCFMLIFEYMENGDLNKFLR